MAHVNIASLFFGHGRRTALTHHTVDVFPDTQVRVEDLLGILIPELQSLDHYVLCNGRRLDGGSQVEHGKMYHIVPRMLGGKGGFGSMLRAIGAQIEKTTSREACRDLSGRRMRDINNEKKLKEWLAKEAEREKEKEERRADRLARRLNPPQHKFEDSQYHEQKAKVQEDLQDALQSGLKRAHQGKARLEQGPSEPKIARTNGSRKEWLGVDIDSDDSDLEADPGTAEDSPTSSSEQEAMTSHSSGENTSEASPSPSHNPDNANRDDENLVQREALASNDVNTVNREESEKKDDKKPASSLLSMLPPPAPLGQPNEVKTEKESAEVKVELPEGPVDLEDYPSEASLCGLGLDRLKFELMSRGLKCGGTQEERAGRLWAVRGLAVEDFPPSLMAKAKGKGKKSK